MASSANRFASLAIISAAGMILDAKISEIPNAVRQAFRSWRTQPAIVPNQFAGRDSDALLASHV
jgi:orotidine-5'-phosphate decarboxylase